MAEQSLYARLGGVFSIAAVIHRFSDEVVKRRGHGPSQSLTAKRRVRRPRKGRDPAAPT